VTWTSPRCTASGDPPSGDGSAQGAPAFAYHPIPQVELPARYLAGGWKTVALGKCSVLADGKHGYVVHGHSSPADASLRVVAGRDVLVVEVHDDHFTGPSAKWLFDDHLELWLADQLPSYMDHCLDRQARPVQWAIRVADGRVFPAYGAPKVAPTVERVVNGSTARFEIHLPPNTGAVTVVYSDGDSGHDQEALLATSRLRFGALPTLGARRAIPAAEAVCEVRGGRLEPKLTRRFTRQAPVIQP
jgi:hypothetical protein